ncbi:MAG TPA: hypothetical protein VNA22_08220 [Pyrinomonadaceae bacterium]|nr:hypothetical protein [Pyrinomonadaceae bacterium]
MRIKIFPLLICLVALSCASHAQTYAPPQPQQPLDPMANISVELSRISRSVATLSQTLGQFVDKFEKVGGMTLTDKQQKMVMGLEILVRSEQRVATLQKAHTELIEKHITVKGRLTQIELDMRPQSIERTTQLQGSVDTVERQETRREKLVAEQRSLTQLVLQIERNITEAEMSLREAQSHVIRLRRTLLPQIEREIEATGN